jgi:hypothetical protein
VASQWTQSIASTRVEQANPLKETLIYNVLAKFLHMQMKTPEAYKDQQDCMRTVCKNRNMTVSDFANRLQFLNMLSEWLIGEDEEMVGTPVLDEEEELRIMYQGLPQDF